MKVIRWILVIVAFAGGWILGSWMTKPEIVESTRIDTVFYAKPVPYESTATNISVRVPRLLFAPADTIESVRVIHDSIEVQLPFEKREYRDSTYYAVVSGISVGGVRPSLDYIETYNRTTMTTQIIRESYQWEAGPSIGTWVSRAGSGSWVGAYARRDFGRFSISATAGYDTYNNGLYGQLQASLAIWKR